MSVSSRALHYVLKVADLKANVEFFRNRLCMTVLRHEVFDEGCEAACNGPYANKWSKTMIGYGPEGDHFVLELTYNYSVGSYKLGNDLQYLKISLKQDLFDKIFAADQETDSSSKDPVSLKSPDGYQFIIERLKNNSRTTTKSDVTEVCLSCTDLSRSTNYWSKLLKMPILETDNETNKETVLRYSINSDDQQQQQACLRLRQISERMDHASAYGRIAFSCPSNELKPIQAACEAANEKVLTSFLSLDTPGKATVQVVILADPDGHEICFVGDEGFRELSMVDPKANQLIEKSMAEDKSNEWFEKKGQAKQSK